MQTKQSSRLRNRGALTIVTRPRCMASHTGIRFQGATTAVNLLLRLIRNQVSRHDRRCSPAHCAQPITPCSSTRRVGHASSRRRSGDDCGSPLRLKPAVSSTDSTSVVIRSATVVFARSSSHRFIRLDRRPVRTLWTGPDGPVRLGPLQGRRPWQSHGRDTLGS